MKGKIIVGGTDSSSSDNQRSEAGSEILENTDKAADNKIPLAPVDSGNGK